MKTKINELAEIENEAENREPKGPHAEGGGGNSSKRSWIMLRGQEVELISRFIAAAEKSIGAIKDVISKSQDER